MDGAVTETKPASPVTVTAPPAASITIDAQNPLPEPNFMWRRILAYIAVMACLALAWFTGEFLHDLGAKSELLELNKWIIGLAALLSTYYYVAPSASELTNMIQSAKIIRHGLEMAASSDKNQTDERMNADNNASRPDFPAPEPDSAPSGSGDSRFPADAPDEASEAAEIDYAPTGKTA